MNNLSFFTKYPTQGATSRHRTFGYICYYLNKNYSYEVNSFFDLSYLNDLYSNKKRNKIKVILSYVCRFFDTLKSNDYLIIEYELFPYIPYWIERILLRKKQYILDFDDNVWDNYANKLFLRNKLNNLVRNASGVIVGNDYLKDKIMCLNSNVIKIPTCIHLTQDNNQQIKYDKFTLVWIGTPVTYKYIKAYSNIFQQLSKKLEYDLVIVAATHLENQKIDGVSMKFFDWSIEIETEVLPKCHVGIMPLTDDNFSLGKSGFKLIQYLAAGLPSMASNIGENNNIIKHGLNGFLLENNSLDWLTAIENLYHDSFLYNQMSKQAFVDAYEFSFSKYHEIHKQFVDHTFYHKGL